MDRAHSKHGGDAYKILVAKPEGSRPLRRPKHRWIDDIKVDHGAIKFGGVDWIYLAYKDWWQALVNTVMNLRFHKMWEIVCLADHTVGFSKRTLRNGVSIIILTCCEQ
jgi:hypothetical protein